MCVRDYPAVLTVQQCRLLSFLKSQTLYTMVDLIESYWQLGKCPPEECLFHLCTTQPGQVFEPQELESPWKFFHEASL